MARPPRNPEAGPNPESIRRRPPRPDAMPDHPSKSRAELVIEAAGAEGIVRVLDGIPDGWTPAQE